MEVKGCKCYIVHILHLVKSCTFLFHFNFSFRIFLSTCTCITETWLNGTFAHGTCIYFVDNCIQNIHLGRYIVGYMVGNDVFSDHITDDIPSQMNILNMGIPILMHFLTLFVKGTTFCTKLKLCQQR